MGFIKFQMPDTIQAKINWLIAEVIIVVLGILIALSIDAWWDDYQQASEAQQLKQELLADFNENHVLINQEIKKIEVTEQAARQLLTFMAEPSKQSHYSSMKDIGNVFTFGSWQPINDTYKEAISSGRLKLIKDRTLRVALNNYQSRLEDSRLIESAIQIQYFDQLEPFMVANTVYSEIAYHTFKGELIEAPFKTDLKALATNRELWNLISLRLELAIANKRTLTRVLKQNDYLIELLESQLQQ
jgi:hypothetical protein